MPNHHYHAKDFSFKSTAIKIKPANNSSFHQRTEILQIKFLSMFTLFIFDCYPKAYFY